MLAEPEELRGSHVHANGSLVKLASLPNCILQQPQSLFVLLDVRHNSAYITHIGGILPIFLLDDILQVEINLCSNAHAFRESGCPLRKDHELLHDQLVASMRTAVDHIERWDPQEDFRAASQVNDVAVDGYPFSAAPALQRARDTPRMALAPNLDFYLSQQFVDLLLFHSIRCLANRAGAIVSLMSSTAFEKRFPMQRVSSL